VGGIGLSWLIAGIVGFTLDIIFLKRSDIAECVNFRPVLKSGPSKKWFKRLFHIGVPACVQDLAWIGGNFFLFSIFAQTPDPTSCQASWAVGLRVEEMIVSLPVFSVSMAIGTIVGQNLGAKQPERAERAGWQCSYVSVAYSAVIGLVMFLMATQLSQIMSHDKTVIAFTSEYFRVIGPAEPFVALWIVLFGAMQGAGYTRWPMWASSICLLLFRLPCAWYLTVPLKMAPLGCWIAIAVSGAAVGLLATWRFKSGVWKQQAV
jgi:Na+-driven multidrug efflux pump